MDYFDTNFNNKESDGYEDLPDDFKWEEMKDGIYDKMDNTKPSTFRKYWPLLLLLLIGGCGTGSWMALEYFNGSDLKEPLVADIKKDIAPLKTKQLIKTTPVDNDMEGSSDNVTTTQETKKTNSELPNNKKSIKTKTTNSISANSDIPTKTLKEKQISTRTIKQTPRLKKEGENLINQLTKPENQRVETASTVPTISWDKIDGLPSKSIYPFEEKSFIDNYPATLKESSKPGFKKYLEIGIAGGVANWAAFDANNINHDFVSGYPGLVFNPSVSLFLNPRHALQLDYEYTAFEELFDYDGSRPIQVSKEDVVVKEVINSLTGNVELTEREDLILNGKRSYREVKYNKYKLHTLSLSYRFSKTINNKSSLGIHGGGAYLFSLNSKGKRLDEQLDVIGFDSANPLFRKNQLGLRLGLSYNYNIGVNTVLFSQISTTKYITNWEVKSSSTATRPFVYGIQVGIRQRIAR